MGDGRNEQERNIGYISREVGEIMIKLEPPLVCQQWKTGQRTCQVPFHGTTFELIWYQDSSLINEPCCKVPVDTIGRVRAFSVNYVVREVAIACQVLTEQTKLIWASDPACNIIKHLYWQTDNSKSMYRITGALPVLRKRQSSIHGQMHAQTAQWQGLQ